MLPLKVKIKKVHSNAQIPKYAKPGDAGMDLVVTTIISDNNRQITYGFGLALEIPDGYVGLIYPRSSVRKTDLILSNCVGVIDSQYRGEIQATFNKTANWYPIMYFPGEKAAQIIIMPYPQIEFTEIDELSQTERGEGGFGSTGI